MVQQLPLDLQLRVPNSCGHQQWEWSFASPTTSYRLCWGNMPQQASPAGIPTTMEFDHRQRALPRIAAAQDGRREDNRTFARQQPDLQLVVPHVRLRKLHWGLQQLPSACPGQHGRERHRRATDRGVSTLPINKDGRVRRQLRSANVKEALNSKCQRALNINRAWGDGQQLSD